MFLRIVAVSFVTKNSNSADFAVKCTLPKMNATCNSACFKCLVCTSTFCSNATDKRLLLPPLVFISAIISVYFLTKMPLTVVETAQIVALVEDGHTQRQVARTVGVSLSTVQRVLQRFQEASLLTRRPGSGRRRTPKALDDRFLVFQALRNRTSTAVMHQNRLEEVRNRNFSVATVRRRLRSS
jgi:transposase